MTVAAARLNPSSSNRRTGAELEANRRRQQRLRARRKKLRAGYRCDADGAVLDMLIRRRYLGEGEADDVAAVSEAITVFLADHAALDCP